MNEMAENITKKRNRLQIDTLSKIACTKNYFKNFDGEELK